MTQAAWTVKDGVLKSDQRRGAWLISDKEYGDFILEFEIKLGELGNSGVALRAPLYGDPAFDGMEMQVADYRYNTSAKDSELTGGIYRAVAPTKQVYRPTQWNTFRIELKGDHLKVTANGEVIQDVDLSKQDQAVKRHDGSACAAGQGPAQAGPHRLPVPQPRRCSGRDPGGTHQGIANSKQPAQRLRTMVGAWTKLGTWLSR